MWRVQSTEDRSRHVSWDDGGLDADPATLEALQLQVDLGTPALLTATGPTYRAADLDDELGVFLLAVQTDAMPGGREIIGSPPRGEAYEVPEGAAA